MTGYWCEHAWLPEGCTASVRIVVGGAAGEAGGDGTIGEVTAPAEASPGDIRLPGLTLPGFADAHSHAFHRALRGRVHAEGSFWTWREAMYSLAGRLDPDRYLALATAVYAELALSGVSCVGEFHYLHHGEGGVPYADPNAMGEALREAARRAGIRMTLLDTCYLAGGIDVPLEGVQLRFGDGDAAGWAGRVTALRDDAGFRVGAAVHSVRGVPAGQLADVAQAAVGRPLHVHLSEQPAENEACLVAYGRTPAALLSDHGVLGPRTTAVHATHLTRDDIALLGGSGTGACFCPTTERDLADGIGPARDLRDAGSPLCLGSDQHAIVDMIEEARALEMNERLASGRRGRFRAGDLVAALTCDGHAALGWSEAGRIEVGAPADLVAIRLDSVRTAGSLPDHALLAATASDITTVVVGGATVARDGVHCDLGEPGPLLAEAIEAAWA